MPSLTGESLWLVLVQLGVGLIGLAALVTLVKSRESERWQQTDIYAVQFIVGHAVALTFLAMMPLVLWQFTMTDAIMTIGSHTVTIWHISSAVCCILLVRLLMGIVHRLEDLRKFPGEKPRAPRALIFGYIIPQTALAVVQAINVFVGSVGLFALGVRSFLAQTLVQIYVIIRFWRQQPVAASESNSRR